MVEEKLDNLFFNIKNDCIAIIREKDISLEELSFILGISPNEFISNFQTRIKDFSFYLETYRILREW